MLSRKLTSHWRTCQYLICYQVQDEANGTLWGTGVRCILNQAHKHALDLSKINKDRRERPLRIQTNGTFEAATSATFNRTTGHLDQVTPLFLQYQSAHFDARKI